MKALKYLCALFIIAIAVFFSAAQYSAAINTENTSQSDIDKSDSAENIISDIASKGRPKINLLIRIVVRQHRNAIDTCRIYPYPVAPPAKKADPSKLPVTDKALRSQALGLGYWSKSRKDKPYPAGGWRMQTAMDAAMQKSGLHPPHTIFTEYPWVDDIIPYLRKEIIKINAIEDDRRNRWNQAQAIFNENRTDLELQSFNQGLFPIDVPIYKEPGGSSRGKVLVDKATWWIVAMHKIAGLKFYWLYPVKLSDYPQQTATLTEDNAIYVEGAW